MSVPRYVRASQAMWRSVGSEVLLSMPGREEVDRLSEPAGAVWHLLDAPRSLAELTDELGSRFRVAPDAIGADVRTLVEELERRGWLERQPSHG